ncbi:tetratricopeptide repeat protein, partial [Desulfobotulus alkaliphilus]
MKFLIKELLRAIDLLNHGQADAALTLSHQLNRKHPSDARVWQLIGLCKLKLHEYTAAIDYLKRAASKISNGELFLGLAKAYVGLGRWEDAVQASQQAIALDSTDVQAYVTCVIALESQKKYLEMRSVLSRGFSLAPYHPELCFVAAKHGIYFGGHDLFEHELLLKLESHQFADEIRALGYSALACCAHEKNCFADAFGYQSHANSLFSSKRHYDADRLLRYLQAFRIMSVDSGCDKDLEYDGVFPHLMILGFSRSGKSLIESLLSCNPKVQALGESKIFTDWVQRRIALKAGGSLLDYTMQLTLETAASERLEYLIHLQQYLKHLPTVITIPDHVLALGVYARLFPHAPLVFVRRDLEDLGLACFFKFYRQDNAYSLSLEAIGREIALYEALLSHWSVELPNPIMQVAYEDLVENTVAVLHR